MLVLTDSQEVDLAVNFTDKKENPATVDGVPVWKSSDESIATVVASADGKTAVAKATGALGQAQVSSTADADLGAGIRSLTATFDIQVQGGEAVTSSISAGTPREQA